MRGTCARTTFPGDKKHHLHAGRPARTGAQDQGQKPKRNKMEFDLSWPVPVERPSSGPLIRLTFLHFPWACSWANLIESLHWTRYAAKLAEPLARRAPAQGTFSAASFFHGLLFRDNGQHHALRGPTKRGRHVGTGNWYSPTSSIHCPPISCTYPPSSSLPRPSSVSTAAVYVGLTAFAAVPAHHGHSPLIGKFMLPAPARGLPAPAAWRRWKQRRDRTSALRKTWKPIPQALAPRCFT